MDKATIHTITKEELKGKMDQGQDFQLVNVLSPEYYHLGFIKGSRKIPMEDLERREQELDKSKEVIVYCASYDCNASHRAAEKLAQHGFNVSAYEGGIKEWKEARFPLEGHQSSSPEQKDSRAEQKQNKPRPIDEHPAPREESP